MQLCPVGFTAEKNDYTARIVLVKCEMDPGESMTMRGVSPLIGGGGVNIRYHWMDNYKPFLLICSIFG